MIKIKIIKNRRYWQVLGLLIADMLFFSVTNASKVASYIVMVGFLLAVSTIFVAIYGTLSLLKLYGLSLKRKARLAAYLTGIVGFLLALKSVGELSLKDVLVLLPLAVIAYLYMNYGKTEKAT